MGYNLDEINTYWIDINDYINTVPCNLVKIWRTDNDGQIAKSNDFPKNNLTGGQTTDKRREKGDAVNL